ncbi:helix-turn-helix domain-containing protein [Enterobacter hormaechei]|uniref:terminase large subunit domain-containing protein n=1 Tax=Enterobacter hormaechei TaxID=158836 RepID=UPI001370C438|nr:terminase family protein [Enterobacter hormaechei]MZJ53350.1 helix-turn-helix domain-containing protein [Enterobacter hormaechei]MZJ73768.1 helix-turn-helix domain-containing protein [Enterobacter hormaechei]MZK03169.1 helix-turn-helix domain-containing protein [Enterobacter hormaechei]MZK14007.1 helix-turn-helix domain-containing protein [Enterobacter hormaechei]MZK21991.1 helix-turn-helix domain-containing protein [Enterobacter hormaechei]
MIQDAFVRQRAKQLYWQGYPPAEIARLMGINQNTIYSWKKRDEWDETPPVQRVSQSMDARLIQLTDKKDKTGGDFKEIDLLTRQLKKLSDGQQAETGAGKKPRKRKQKNHFTEEQIVALREKILDSLSWHQRGWYEQRHHRNRMILKSRQIGATWYFAREALLDALRDDVKYPYQRNQIFLSASRRQAHQFRGFIQRVAEEVDVELKGGDKIVLSNGAELHFLGTSAATAQSYTGNLKFDEFFWVSNFTNLRKVAGAMATLKGLTRTYFSTPSGETHEAYPFWTGDRWNEKRTKAQRKAFDVGWKTLNSGLLCPDKTWRQIVTLKDVIENGWEYTDLEEIQDENSEDEFRNLYMCEFVRDGESAFNLNALIGCGADGYDEWPDWKPFASRPMGNRPVWIGYDANGSSGNGDSGAICVVVPPLVPGGKFRTVETEQVRGLEFEEQAKVIENFTFKYNVQHVGIDVTGGNGEAVYQIVKKFFPMAMPYTMSMTSKRALVLKMLQLIRAGRWEYDRSERALINAFNSVRKVKTPGGFITYDTDRSRGVSHGDLAWANMLAIINEPLGQESGSGGFAMEF